MDNKMVENNQYTNEENIVMVPETVNVDLLEAIKNFMDDLSSITTNQNFKDFHTIVKRIDETKVKSYPKLVEGFKKFFVNNEETITLNNGDLNGLKEPVISYTTNNGSFEFNFQQVLEEAEECEQEAIKDHLNLIWKILNNTNKGPEELYIDKIFKDLKSRFSPDLSREEQMMIAKELFSDFQRQNFDISVVVKVACRKARKLLLSNGSEDHSNTMLLIDAVEELDVNNFNMIQFMGLVGKISTLFADGEHNPLSGLLSSVFSENNIPFDQINQNEDSN